MDTSKIKKGMDDIRLKFEENDKYLEDILSRSGTSLEEPSPSRSEKGIPASEELGSTDLDPGILNQKDYKVPDYGTDAIPKYSKPSGKLITPTLDRSKWKTGDVSK